MSAASLPTVRAATAGDADAIGRLVAEFQDYLRGLGDRSQFAFNAATYLRDGWGPHPAFSGLVAELDGRLIGYLLYHFGYDTDQGMRLMWVIDLFVQERHRSRGAGQALMRRAAEIARDADVGALIWTVLKTNQLAFRFYEQLGGQRMDDLELMHWRLPR